MRYVKLPLTFVLACGVLCAGSDLPVPGTPAYGKSEMLVERRVEAADAARQAKRLYYWSAGALIASNVADAASSWGKYEGNPFLRSSTGHFGWGGIAIKSGIVAGTLVGQRFLLKRHPEQAKRSAWMNFMMSGVFTGVAVRNSRLPSR